MAWHNDASAARRFLIQVALSTGRLSGLGMACELLESWPERDHGPLRLEPLSRFWECGELRGGLPVRSHLDKGGDPNASPLELEGDDDDGLARYLLDCDAHTHGVCRVTATWCG